jgi:hypothetical protein
VDHDRGRRILELDTRRMQRAREREQRRHVAQAGARGYRVSCADLTRGAHGVREGPVQPRPPLSFALIELRQEITATKKRQIRRTRRSTGSDGQDTSTGAAMLSMASQPLRVVAVVTHWWSNQLCPVSARHLPWVRRTPAARIRVAE